LWWSCSPAGAALPWPSRAAPRTCSRPPSAAAGSFFACSCSVDGRLGAGTRKRQRAPAPVAGLERLLDVVLRPALNTRRRSRRWVSFGSRRETRSASSGRLVPVSLGPPQFGGATMTMVASPYYHTLVATLYLRLWRAGPRRREQRRHAGRGGAGALRRGHHRLCRRWICPLRRGDVGRGCVELRSRIPGWLGAQRRIRRAGAAGARGAVWRGPRPLAGCRECAHDGADDGEGGAAVRESPGSWGWSTAWRWRRRARWGDCLFTWGAGI